MYWEGRADTGLWKDGRCALSASRRVRVMKCRNRFKTVPWTEEGRMMAQRLLLVCLLYCCIRTGTARCRSRALFPAANSRLKRSPPSVVNPSFYHSFKDAHLLFEILISGIHFEASGEVSVDDEELASLRQTRKLEVICEEIVPRNVPDILRLVSHISKTHGHLHQDEFERTLLTLVYTTQRMANSTSKHQREAWAQSFVHLYKAIKQDLTT